jgi:hypothetical protein
VLWNTLYSDHAVKQLATDGLSVTDELLARLSPLQFEHINVHGRYTFPPAAARRCAATAARPARPRRRGRLGGVIGIGDAVAYVMFRIGL